MEMVHLIVDVKVHFMMEQAYDEGKGTVTLKILMFSLMVVYV